jgi:hypothetical protein
MRRHYRFAQVRCGDAPHALNLVRAGEMGAPAAHGGSTMLRSEIRPEDLAQGGKCPNPDSPGAMLDRHRAYLQLWGDGPLFPMERGHEYWFRGSFHIPSAAPIGARTNIVQFAFHWNPASQSKRPGKKIVSGPNVILYPPSQELRFHIARIGEFDKTCDPRTNTCGSGETVPLDRWFTVTAHTYWSKESDGFARIWVDNNLAVDLRGPTIACEADEPTACYDDRGFLVVGQYTGSGYGSLPGASVLYIDDLEIRKVR